MPHAEGLKIAILINEGSVHNVPMKAAFEQTFDKLAPTATIEFFDPVNKQTYPDVSKFDFIVLSGGSAFVMDDIPWVVKMKEFIRFTVESYPKKKIMGICWGHQIINVALGGHAREMGFADVRFSLSLFFFIGNCRGFRFPFTDSEPFKIGVHTVKLTPKGSAFLGDSLLTAGQINIQQFHKRDIDVPADGFIPLATNNESFINPENTIVTFQGHPEMTVEWGSEAAAGFPAYVALTGKSMEDVQESIRLPTDGQAIWRRVLSWVRE